MYSTCTLCLFLQLEFTLIWFTSLVNHSSQFFFSPEDRTLVCPHPGLFPPGQTRAASCGEGKPASYKIGIYFWKYFVYLFLYTESSSYALYISLLISKLFCTKGCMRVRGSPPPPPPPTVLLQLCTLYLVPEFGNIFLVFNCTDDLNYRYHLPPCRLCLPFRKCYLSLPRDKFIPMLGPHRMGDGRIFLQISAPLSLINSTYQIYAIVLITFFIFWR
jgi:hypothetical protein